jgi:GNAT superfamily N-acetyltransferase
LVLPLAVTERGLGDTATTEYLYFTQKIKFGIFVGGVKMTIEAKAFIHQAVPTDCDRVAELANAAYSPYLKRMDKKPAPMTDDYATLIAGGCVSVLEVESETIGYIVLIPEKNGAMLLDNLAVDPEAQGRGFGKMLIDYAEKQAREAGFHRIFLYTNEVMTENLRYYPRLGYTETHRAWDKGFNRVFFSKDL